MLFFDCKYAVDLFPSIISLFKYQMMKQMQKGKERYSYRFKFAHFSIRNFRFISSSSKGWCHQKSKVRPCKYYLIRQRSLNLHLSLAACGATNSPSISVHRTILLQQLQYWATGKKSSNITKVESMLVEMWYRFVIQTLDSLI